MTDSRPPTPIPLPTGTVTFLFTDIEGSTDLAQQYPDALPALLARHHALLQQAIEAHHGYVFQIIGDSFHVAFHTAPDAIQAALDAQRLLQHEAWDPAPIKVRMGINTGAAQAVNDDDRSGGYSGYSTLARVQRVMSTANGGQVLLSNASADLVQSELPAGVTLRDMGEHHLKGLASLERLWQIVAPDLISDFPALATLSVVPNNLPTQLTSFIGRDKEIAEVKRLLLGADAAAAPHRMVTLTAVGGTGKTRLSIEVGTQVLAEFPQGIWLIELAPLTNPVQIIPALAQVVGLKEIPPTPLTVTVTDYLREKKALLILDNCEHLIEACARLADDWLHHCVRLKILASSREALGIAGEVAYHMPSLAGTESIQLFVDRARAVNSNFSQTASNAAAIAQICDRLDGIPLAIELAAARAKVLTPEQISTRLNDRFHLLVGGSRTALPRQQTLRALIDWSYDLLSAAEKRLLQFASVFVGGWTLEALEAIADDPDTLELLEQLVNKSLVTATRRENEMRYGMLETIRQYAGEKLFDAAQASAARNRHFSFFHDMAAGMWESFHTLKEYTLIQAKAYDELENMRAALNWGVEHQPEAALRLAANFTIISAYTGSQADGLDWLSLALKHFHALPPIEGEANRSRQAALANGLFAQGLLSMLKGNSQLALQSLREAIALARSLGDKWLLGMSLEIYYTTGSFQGVPDGPAAAEEGFAILNEIDDVWGWSAAYNNMARLAAARGDYEASRKYFDVLNTKLKATHVSFMTGVAYIGAGYAERDQGHLDIARQRFEEALKVFKLLRHKGFETVALSEIGHTARAQGDTAQARRIYRETITRFQDFGNRGAIAHQLECFAFIALSEAEPARAVKLLAAASALREKINALRAELEQAEYDQAITQLHSVLAEAVFNPLWAEGRAMTMEEAIQLALS